MKVKVLEQITLSKRVLHPGEIIDVPDALLSKLGGRVKPITRVEAGDPRGLPCYCQAAGCWCSSKLSHNNYPAACIHINCVYHSAIPATSGG